MNEGMNEMNEGVVWAGKNHGVICNSILCADGRCDGKLRLREFAFCFGNGNIELPVALSLSLEFSSFCAIQHSILLLRRLLRRPRLPLPAACISTFGDNDDDDGSQGWNPPLTS